MDIFDRPLTRRQALGGLVAFAASLRMAGTAAAQPTALSSLARWNTAMELRVDFEIARPGGRAARPYIAVWVENPNGAAVRTLGLWVQTRGRGTRWIQDLRRWSRTERERRSAEGGDLIATASSATRPPGTYSLVWDGRSDSGDLVEQGDYFVCIEAVREHGSYQLIRERRSFGSEPFRVVLTGNQEISAASLDFHRRG